MPSPERPFLPSPGGGRVGRRVRACYLTTWRHDGRSSRGSNVLAYLTTPMGPDSRPSGTLSSGVVITDEIAANKSAATLAIEQHPDILALVVTRLWRTCCIR